MSAQPSVQDLSFPVKVYVGLVHLLLLFLVILFLRRPFKGKNKDARRDRKSRTFTKDNRAVTMESCEWINSTLAWFYLHAHSNNDKDRTPNIVKLWLRALNKQLQKDKKKNQRIVIDGLTPGCLPPNLTSVYCLCVSGNMQCIMFHVESADLGFQIQVVHQTSDGPKTTHFETRVVKLTGEVALQLSTAPSKLEVSVQFIGDPEFVMSTKCLTKDSEVDGTEVQEKVKEVICKTITSIPLTDATSRERLNSDAGSASSKERLNSQSSISCVGEEGKLLVKVIKASGLCGKDKTGPISPYCIVSTSSPLQRKRTSMVKDNDSPFWNEYFTFDITPKTKEITLDIYDYEKTEKDANGHLDDNEFTEEQDDYLGQVIVPLSTVNRDQTCRLILPVLPRSSKSEHSKGDISLEFTFDKDGKVIDATLPVISGLEQKVRSSDGERTSAPCSPMDESPGAFMNGDSGVNGHAPRRKRYIESSLDELAMEIEAYEHSDEERPKPPGYFGRAQGADDEEPELHREPVIVAASQAGPSRDKERKEEEEEIAIAELLKSTEEEEPKESKEKKGESEDETREKGDEKQEVKETERKDGEDQSTKKQDEKTEEPGLKPKHRRSFNLFKKKKVEKMAEKVEEKLEETGAPEEETHENGEREDIAADVTELKEGDEEEDVQEQVARGDEHRRSFNLFKRKKVEKMAEKVEEKLEETGALEEETHENGEKEDIAAEDTELKEGDEEDVQEQVERGDEHRRSFNLFKRRKAGKKAEKAEDKIEEAGVLEEETRAEEGEDVKETGAVDDKEGEDDGQKAKEEEESTEQAAGFDTKPKLRRSFNLFKRRPQSMAAADRKMDTEDRGISRHDPVRHSYHAGDLPVPDPSNLRKSTSQSSLLSYSPNPHSTLIVETVNKGQKRYSHIPPVMARRGAYEKGGNKLHVYNDHIFTAVHFTGSLPECAVCGKSIKGKVGKQGYQCRGCKMVTHRDCHYETTAMCSSDAVKHMEIIKMPQFVGH